MSIVWRTLNSEEGPVGQLKRSVVWITARHTLTNTQSSNGTWSFNTCIADSGNTYVNAVLCIMFIYQPVWFIDTITKACDWSINSEWMTLTLTNSCPMVNIGTPTGQAHSVGTHSMTVYIAAVIHSRQVPCLPHMSSILGWYRQYLSFQPTAVRPGCRAAAQTFFTSIFRQNVP